MRNRPNSGKTVQRRHVQGDKEFGAESRSALQQRTDRVEAAAFQPEWVEVNEDCLLRDLFADFVQEALAVSEDWMRKTSLRKAFECSRQCPMVAGTLVDEVRDSVACRVLCDLRADDER